MLLMFIKRPRGKKFKNLSGRNKFTSREKIRLKLKTNPIDFNNAT
jgi:hypothetical protein